MILTTMRTWVMHKIILGVLMAFGLAGCSSIGQVKDALEFGADQAVETSRYGLNAARWETCVGARVGALMMEFNTDEERAAWELFCESYWKQMYNPVGLPVSENPYAE